MNTYHVSMTLSDFYQVDVESEDPLQYHEIEERTRAVPACDMGGAYDEIACDKVDVIKGEIKD